MPKRLMAGARKRLESLFGPARPKGGDAGLRWRIGITGSPEMDCWVMLRQREGVLVLHLEVVRVRDCEGLLRAEVRSIAELEGLIATVRDRVSPAGPHRVVGVPQ